MCVCVCTCGNVYSLVFAKTIKKPNLHKESHFFRFEDLALIVEKTNNTLEWPARESMKPVEQEPKASPELSSGAESAAAKTEETAFVEMESDIARAKNVRKRSSSRPRAKQEYTHHLK